MILLWLARVWGLASTTTASASMNATSAMGPCPGVITNEIILDPYQNVGQYGGAIFGAGLPALFFLAFCGFNCCRVIYDDEGGCQVVDSWPGFCYRILYTGYFALFTVSLLLQVLAHLMSFAGENTELLFARVLLVLACGCRLCLVRSIKHCNGYFGLGFRGFECFYVSLLHLYRNPHRIPHRSPHSKTFIPRVAQVYRRWCS